jgi:hypothetical protein
MAYKIDELLALPAKDRRRISSKLIESLPENKPKLTDEEIALLNSRWENHLTGKSKNYSGKEMLKLVFNAKS